MSAIAATKSPARVVYPDSDGQPIAENTKQFRWIVTIQGGLDAVFAGDPNVFVAGDLFWYPVEGDNTIRVAPDTLVVFGRPKGDRGSYLQWLEDNIAPQVTFEVLSPANRAGELIVKFKFYERYGVEECYVWEPDNGALSGGQRRDGELRAIDEMHGWVSPRLKVRFELVDGDLRLYGPDGKPFATYLELAAQRDEAARQRDEAARQRDEAAQQRDRLAAQLRALGIDPETGGPAGRNG
jgi:Uma2 family endonuclease